MMVNAPISLSIARPPLRPAPQPLVAVATAACTAASAAPPEGPQVPPYCAVGPASLRSARNHCWARLASRAVLRSEPMARSDHRMFSYRTPEACMSPFPPIRDRHQADLPATGSLGHAASPL